MVEITPGSPFSGIKPIVTVEEGHKVWHLVKHDDLQNQSRAQKVISEIFLTRLLSTKVINPCLLRYTFILMSNSVGNYLYYFASKAIAFPFTYSVFPFRFNGIWVFWESLIRRVIDL